MITLAPLTLEHCETVRKWRNDHMIGLRTPFMLTYEMQESFYREVVCNRQAPHRYWAATWTEDNEYPIFVGMVGLTGIGWENGIAEISLITDPTMPGRGYGRAAVLAVLAEAFQRMRLLTVFGECYSNNPALGFWQRMVQEFKGEAVMLPRRKWWDGTLWPAYYFTFTAEAFDGGPQ